MTTYIKPTREEWHNAYINELREMYLILLEKMGIETDTEISFRAFSKLIYASSSGDISQYTISNINE